MKADKIKDFLLDLIFPNRCFMCNNIILWDKTCCDECFKQIPFIDEKLCPKCGKANCVCNLNICYDKCFSIAWYDSVMKNAVVRFKRESPYNFSKFFGKELSKQILAENFSFDIVTCTPMSKKSRKDRGYNQASYLAKVIANELDVKFDEKLLFKKDSKIHQHELGFDERMENAFKSFSFNDSKDVKGKRILLVDDIVTTASTLNSCARLLKNNGAKSVVCAVACNTKYNKD